MCTTGNFSDELNNKDIAKCAIGYLPTLIDLKAELEERLLAIYGSKIWLAKEWQRSWRSGITLSSGFFWELDCIILNQE